VGSDYEFFGRPEWTALQKTYGLEFADRTSYDSTFMYDALVNGEVDVISAFSTDGRIAAYDLRVLDDPRNAIPPYDAMILLSPRAASDDRVVEALRLLVGAIDADAMRKANYRVDRDRDKQTPSEAALWLRGRLSRQERSP
jgi:osmoprotectant transport system permease protein